MLLLLLIDFFFFVDLVDCVNWNLKSRVQKTFRGFNELNTYINFFFFRNFFFFFFKKLVDSFEPGLLWVADTG